MTKTHEYPVQISWSGTHSGVGELLCQRSGLKLPFSIPKEFKGLDKGTNPEELITASIASCYTMILSILLEIKGIKTNEIKVSSIGFIDTSKPKAEYNKIVLDVQIFLPSDMKMNVDKAKNTAILAEQQCIMANATKGNVEIIINPEVF